MLTNSKYEEYVTVNSNTPVFIVFDSVSHVIKCKEESIEKNGETCWIHFHNGKCIHVTESYADVTHDLREYLNNE